MNIKLILVFVVSSAVIFSACDSNQTIVYEPAGKRLAARRIIAAEASVSNETINGMSPHASVADDMEQDADTAEIMGADPGQEHASMMQGMPHHPSMYDSPTSGVMQVQIAGISIIIPAWWEIVPAENLSRMRVAQFNIKPSTKDGRGAELVGFYFGEGQGGDAQANISRWLGQVSGDEQPMTKQREINGLNVSEVYTKGTLMPSMMGPGPKEPQPDSALYGIIFEGGPLGSVFLKMTGDAATVESVRPTVEHMIMSARPAQ